MRRARTREHEPRLHTLVNTYGRGPANAIRYGIDQVDDPGRRGHDGRRQRRPSPDRRRSPASSTAASSSPPPRATCAGGQQVGGPLLKGLLSQDRRAVARACWPASAPATRPTASRPTRPTSSARSASTAAAGFEIGLELTAKARRLRRPVAEIPTIWLDRTIGDSNFELASWIPKYLRWYRFAFGPQLSVDEVQREPRRSPRVNNTPTTESASCVSENRQAEGPRLRLGRLHRRLRRRGAAPPRLRRRRRRQLLASTARSRSPTTTTPTTTSYEDDARDVELMTKLLADCDHFIAGAALIGGISYFHAYAYDLLATNERIMASQCDAAIEAHRSGQAEEGHLPVQLDGLRVDRALAVQGGRRAQIPPPLSSYGFQKLAVEYFAKAAWDQYQLPYTIVRPFNCVGIGEGRALGDVEVDSGNVKLAMSHVVPDLVQKIVKGQDPLHILGEGNQIRHYTYGGDLARGIVECMEQDAALNDDFNISTPESTTVRELAEVIWRKIKGDAPLTIVSDPAYEYDVQKRVPDVTKAKRGAGLRVHDLARRDARRGHPVGDPGRRRRSALSEGALSMNEASDDRLTHQQEVWESWAQADPLWAILSHPAGVGVGGTSKSSLPPASRISTSRCRRPGRFGLPARRGRALDFGCGVGRLTQALGAEFEHADGVDISDTMIDLARQYNKLGERCAYHVNLAADLALFEDRSMDFVFSTIVLQHVPPQHAATYITEFVRLLAPGGAAVFDMTAAMRSVALPPGAHQCVDRGVGALAPAFGAGQSAILTFTVTNASELTWPAGSLTRLGNHWRTADGEAVALDDGLDLVGGPVGRRVRAGRSP